MSLRELKRAARNDLKGKWHIGIIVTIVAFIIGVYSFGLLPMINLPAEEWLKDPSVLLKDWRNIFYFDMRSVRMGLFYLLGAAGVLGQCYCFLLMANQEQCRIRDIFHCYPQMVPAIGLRLLRSVYTFLGLSLLVVPGVYLYYVYALAPCIMADNPDIGARKALQLSKRAMDGYKMRMLMLDLSFIGWFVLCVLSMGIGLLFLIPYHCAARAEFFKEVKNHKKVKPA